MAKRMRLRSAVPPEEKEQEKKERIRQEKEKLNRPPIKYKGNIYYHTTFMDCAQACDNLLKFANECKEDALAVGFDLEWPFNFQTGPGKTAVIQISPTLDICYVLHVSEIKKLPKGLTEFLHHPKVKLTGVNIKNDIRKLCRDFSGFDAERIIQNCIDAGVLANTILPVTQRWSMEKLVDYVLKMKISKDKKVRMSKWHIVPLPKPQVVYAATDAFASLLLYQTLREKEQEQNNKEQNPNDINLLF